MLFDKLYCKESFPKQDYQHFCNRAEWIGKNVVSGRVIILGSGYGWTVHYLLKLGIDVIGIELSNYIYQNSEAQDNIQNIDASLFSFKPDDNVFSWNFLDCLNEVNAEMVCRKIEGKQIHIVCTDNGDIQSDQYRNDGFFIKPIEYWMGLLPEATIIDYHSRKVYNGESLKIPLSWKFISE